MGLPDQMAAEWPKRRSKFLDVAARVPLAGMLVVTDAPRLAPPPNRGKRKEPGRVAHTAEALAGVLRVSQQELAAATTKNFENLFGMASAA